MAPGTAMRRAVIRASMRDLAEAYNRGDRAVFISTLAPDGVVRPFVGSDWRGDLAESYQGPEGYAEFLDTWEAPWEETSVVYDEVVDLGDTLIVTARFSASARQGLDFEQTCAYVSTLVDGMIQELDIYWDRWQDAFGAVGLPEPITASD